ncbi:protease modulator HflK [Sphingomonas koreensis]|jgi:membrane protease subunit HflK|uniref:Protease modulator HflK n=1 Tax=Sphingomonas koreensis TaxID=93064 RepID=A0A1L6JA90_9SPHN|nr:protease modulator HflK [Sphingomonas koreensis]APR52420.1 protease modulator HflK [Sphingomonas koreensis]MDC7811579.1 protease modulator HflK [Sphingomonas koreensis]RSU19693.1 protease modulator HflK [Sphingomonas koreensis]RSU26481.1 protease modulator HflK [Sphingomonas koreensis]RSU27263.1 protease modulator HflK [Sphingomonas koreensis]
MAKLIGWIARAPGLWGVLSNENKGPQSPWGGGKGGNDGGDAGKGGGSGGGDDAGGGPRNPWAFPPEGKRGGRGSVTSLDDFLKRARKGGGGSGGGFPGGVPGKPVIFGGIAIVLLLWIAFTSFHVIAPEQRGVVAFFGKYSSTLEPGVRFTLPAPIASVKKINVQQIRTENFPATSGENLMLTQDQNIVDLAYSVRWDIANPEDYVFQIAKPEQTVRATAESAMRAAVAGVTLNDAIGPGRTVVEARVQQATQAILDEYNSGIRIQGVSIRGAAAPGAVDEAFKQVTAAQQESEGARNQARAYAQQIIALAQGEAAQFDKIYEQYKAAPDVTRRRLYYETMEAVLAKSNKTIVETNGVTPYLPLPAARGGTTQPSVQQGQQAQQGQPQGGAQ